MECLCQTHLQLGNVVRNSIPENIGDGKSRTQKPQTPAFVGLSRHISLSQLSRTSHVPLLSQARKCRSGRFLLNISASTSSPGIPSLTDLPLIKYINNQGHIIPHIEGGTQASVFAVFDTNKKIQYIGFSKDVRNSLQTLWGRRPDLCQFYKIYNVKELDKKATVEIQKHWFSELGLPPAGNTEHYQSDQWDEPAGMGSVSESGIVAAASSKASSMLLTMKDRGPKEEMVYTPSLLEQGKLSRQQNKDDDKRMRMLKKLVPAVLLALVAATLWRPSPALASSIAGDHFVGAGAGAGAGAGTATAIHRVTGTEFLTAAWTGLVAGWLHTLSGPDHLAALAPLSIGRTRMESAAVGALWGCGHDAGQVLFGIAFVLLRDKLHLDLFRLWGARIVGLTLMAIGGMGVYESSQLPIQCDAGDEDCLAQPGAVVFSSDKRVFSVATFATGIVHGLQPDALLVILPALALPSKLAGAAFLGMFLVGTVMAMGVYTSFIGILSEACNQRVPWLTSRLSLGASVIAILVGMGIILGEIFGFSLFG